MLKKKEKEKENLTFIEIMWNEEKRWCVSYIVLKKKVMSSFYIQSKCHDTFIKNINVESSIVCVIAHFMLMYTDINGTCKSVNLSKSTCQNSSAASNFIGCGWVWYYKSKSALGCGWI